MNKHSLFISNFKFFIKLAIFFSIIFLICNHVSGQFEEEYNAALIDKVERLKSIEEPKIVLLGNSNVAFGFQSELIENEFGIPVVNMGLHGGLGNMFHEEMARINVTPGDVYVLCHNSYNDPSVIYDPVLAWTTVENNFELYQIFRKEDIWPMIKAYPTYLKKCLERYSEEYEMPSWDTVYSRKAFNKYGDVGERKESVYETDVAIAVPRISEENIARINELAKWLEERGATLVVAGYPIAMGDKSPSKEEYIQFQMELEEALECDMISDYTDYMYGYECFLDTQYHLLSETAVVRTRQLISDLKKWREF